MVVCIEESNFSSNVFAFQKKNINKILEFDFIIFDFMIDLEPFESIEITPHFEILMIEMNEWKKNTPRKYSIP